MYSVVILSYSSNEQITSTLFSYGLEQSRVVKAGSRHVVPPDGEAGGVQSLDDFILRMQVRSSCLRRPREEFPDLLENVVPKSLRSKGDDESLASKASKFGDDTRYLRQVNCATVTVHRAPCRWGSGS